MDAKADRSAIVLKPSWEQFCWEYVMNGGNGASAYRKVHPNVKQVTSYGRAVRLTSKDNVRARIEQIREEQREKFRATHDDLIEYHGKVMKVDRRDFVKESGEGLAERPIDELNEDAASILEFEVQRDPDGNHHILYKVPARHQSATELAKIMGLHKDRREISGPGGGPIETDTRVSIYIPDNERDERDD